MSKELSLSQSAQYVGPYRLEKTLGKGQTGEYTKLFLIIKRFKAIISCRIHHSRCIFLPLMLVCLLFLPLYFSFRTGQARGPLYYGSEGSDQNSQQREAV